MTNFTLNDVLRSQKEVTIAEILDRTLNVNSQSDGFLKVVPKHISKSHVLALESPSRLENEQIVQDLKLFKKKLGLLKKSIIYLQNFLFRKYWN